jgi:hypothetical protein
VSTHAFISLHNLHSLVLSHNDLETVHHETLAGLSVLRRGIIYCFCTQSSTMS